MDNKAYLDQIAVKGKVATGPAVSPALIKIIVAGIITIITLIIVGLVINGSNAKVTQNYEHIYLRMSNIISEDGAISENLERIKDSDLRSHVVTFLTAIKTSHLSLESLAPNIGIKPEKITKEVQREEDANNAHITVAIENSVMTGNVDEVYGTEIYYQINTLIAFEQEAQTKNTNKEFAKLLNDSLKDLLQLQAQFKKYNNISN